MKRSFTLVLTFIIVLTLFPYMPIRALHDDPVLRIGLAYGNNARSAAKLINYAGQKEGYDIGYYDGTTDAFQTLFSTNQRELAILKDKPMWVTNSDDYYDTKPSSYKKFIGSYHLEANTTFYSYAEVINAANNLNTAGLMAFPAYVNGGYRLRVGAYTDTALANASMSEATEKTGYSFSVVGQSATCYTVTLLGTDQILFEFDHGSTALGIRPKSQECWFNGYRYMGGFEYIRAAGNDLTVLNVVGMTDYIKGVLPYEVGSNWPTEALKAQALCAKSFAYNMIGIHKSAGFDLCTTEHCQLYRGMAQANDTSNAAVEAVQGLYVTYNGTVAQTFYHASSGGYTEDAGNIWGTHIPYLRAVEDIHLTDTRPYSVTVSLRDVTEILQSKGYITQSVTDFYISRTSAAGNVLELTFVLSDGTTRVFKGDQVRTALYSSSKGISIGSHRFTIGGSGIAINGKMTAIDAQGLWAIAGDGTVAKVSANTVTAMTARGLETVNLQQQSGSDYVIYGTGSGHNIGMSQMGAFAMAQKGYTYEQIIKFYFTGVEVGYLP